MKKPHNEFVDFFHQIERLNKDRKQSRPDPAPFHPKNQQQLHQPPPPETRPLPIANPPVNLQAFPSKNRDIYAAFDSDKSAKANLADFKFLEDKLQYKANIPSKVTLLQEIMLSDEPLVSVEEV